MSLHQLILNKKTVDVALSMSGTRMAVLSDTDVAVYALDMQKRPIPLPYLLWRTDVLASCPRHVAFAGDEQVFVLTDDWDEQESCLWTNKGEKLVYKGRIEGPAQTSSIASGVDFQNLYVQYQDGSLHEAKIEEAGDDLPLQSSLVNKFPSFAPEARVVTLNEQVCT
jgi:elongator complex protein 1